MHRKVKLIVGLGNPGAQYTKTRHNIGFLAVEKLSEKFNISKYNTKFNAIYYGPFDCDTNCRVILMQPETYMNNSGSAVQAFCSFFKISIDNIIVIHDDIDLVLGKIKVKIGGGNGGHNGLKSIDSHIGTNYLRIRLGIDRPVNHQPVSDYVLQNFLASEIGSVDRMLESIATNIDCLLVERISVQNLNKFLAACAITK